MCGRYTYLFKWKQLHDLMRLLEWPPEELSPRYNVAPSQTAPVVRLNAGGDRAGVMLEWGLVPSWVKDPATVQHPINARGETVFSKPTFRVAARERRCLVPVSGFYEWQKVDGRGRKVPHWIGRADRAPICFAGLWEAWRDKADPDRAALETFTIITTSPNPLMAGLHDRMPVIVGSDDWRAWLDPGTPRADLERLIAPCSGGDLIAYPVGTAVNSPKTDRPGLIEPVEPRPGTPEAPNLFG